MLLGKKFEYTLLIIFILGIIFSFAMENMAFHFIAFFLFGIVAATFQQLKKHHLNFPFVILIIGFVVGYLIATKSGYKLVSLIFFFLGIIVGVYLKRIAKKYIETIN